MSFEAISIIDDISHHIGNDHYKRGQYAPYILRMMNRLYRAINTKLLCLEKTLTIDAGSFSSAIDYYAIPSDWIKPFRVEPRLVYSEPDNFTRAGDELNAPSRCFTIKGSQLIFSNVDASSAYEFWYYSSGLSLVAKEDADLSSDEINTPEWPWGGVHDILFYGTCLLIDSEYDMRKQDIQEYIRLWQDLAGLAKVKQDITPMIPGGWGIVRGRDDYGMEVN